MDLARTGHLAQRPRARFVVRLRITFDELVAGVSEGTTPGRYLFIGRPTAGVSSGPRRRIEEKAICSRRERRDRGRLSNRM